MVLTAVLAEARDRLREADAVIAHIGGDGAWKHGLSSERVTELAVWEQEAKERHRSSQGIRRHPLLLERSHNET